MRITEIKEGQVVKNYKELCELLGEKPKPSGSNSQKAHIKKFERYFEYTKEGHKYIIAKIYDKKKKKEDNRGGNNKVFVDDFEKIMVYSLYHNKNHKNNTCKMVASKGKLLKLTHMVNTNYDYYKYNIKELSKILNIDNAIIEDFYNFTNKKLYDTIDRNLLRLRMSKVIDYNKSKIVLVREVTDIKTNELNEVIIKANGEVEANVEVNHRIATDEERKLILEYEKEVLKELGCKNEVEAYLKGMWKNFKNLVEKELLVNGTNIIYYYNGYDIVWSRKVINDLYKEYFSDNEDIKQELTNVNDNMIKSVNKSTKARHTKAINQLPNTNIDNKYKFKQLELQASENYIEDSEQITMTVIYEGAEKYDKSKSKVSNESMIGDTHDFEVEVYDLLDEKDEFEF